MDQTTSLITIDWAQFTPISATLGGMLIGAAAFTLYVLNGRIMGASGILNQTLRALTGQNADAPRNWQSIFLIGVVIGPMAFYLLFGDWPAREQVTSAGGLALAGLLVGLGTGIGSGCTSGHGICGLARFSKRSIVAVVTFMGSGMITAYLITAMGGL